MSNVIENSSPMASNHDHHKSHFNPANDEANSQPSTAATSPFNSFIVEYDDGVVSLYPHGLKEPNIGSKELTLSGELGQPKSVFIKQNINPAMQPPPAQLMGEYDPNRIPGSAFCNKNATVDWSVTSNESLFSIHMGNASFNRDHPMFFQKSQELPKLDDMNKMNHSSALPQISEATNVNGKQEFLLHHAPNVVLPGTLEDRKKETSTGNVERVSAELSSTPRNSNGSNSLMPAFSFPVLDNPDTNNSLGKLSPDEINSHTFYFETPKFVPENQIAMNSPVSAAPTVKNTSWFYFSCCQG